MAGHLRMSLETIREDDGDFDDLHSLAPQPMGHLDLETVAIRAHFIQPDGFERPLPKTFVTAGRICERHAGDDLYILGGALAQHEAAQRPVDHANPIQITRAENK